MRINHNIAALNTHRQLNTATTNQSKSMEKLASGLRINKAGDDAAGLAISEKMRGQIRGLDQASKNAQDGISMIATAEGALNETHDILQRMRELATQSANDTNTTSDRGEIQKEVDQLAEEITRIANNTEFNTQTLLNGGIQDGKKGAVKFHVGANSNQNISVDIKAMDAKSLGIARDEKSVALDSGASGISGATLTAGASLIDGTYNIASADVSAGKASVTGATGFAAGAGTDEVGAAGDLVLTVNGVTKTITVAATDKIGDLVTNINAQFTGLASPDSGQLKLESSATGAAQNITIESASNAGVLTGLGLSTGEHKGNDASLTFTLKDSTNTTTYETVTGVALNATEVSFNNTGVKIEKNAGTTTSLSGSVTVSSDQAAAATFDSTGKLTNAAKANAGINVSTQGSASDAIGKINEAIETVSAERSKLGAIQNRLDHTINNLGTSSENLTAAESRIRDVDMAKEMMEQTKNSILSQAAQAMLAQAQQTPQGVLQLLR
ncbi:flagellin [Sporosarcina ureae]|uniref:flagellin N-terminal helical domain-containing protein n=1 Tax=Sporosarcina ureae TaxID=1571 RepID=UPI000421CEA5|nr:flagellin [Sporosarcina ureae]